MPYEEIVRNLGKKFPRTASTGKHKTRLASGTDRFADLLLKIDGTCYRGHDTPTKTSNHTRKKKKKKKKTMYKKSCYKRLMLPKLEKKEEESLKPINNVCVCVCVCVCVSL